MIFLCEYLKISLASLVINLVFLIFCIYIYIYPIKDIQLLNQTTWNSKYSRIFILIPVYCIFLMSNIIHVWLIWKIVHAWFSFQPTLKKSIIYYLSILLHPSDHFLTLFCKLSPPLINLPILTTPPPTWCNRI